MIKHCTIIVIISTFSFNSIAWGGKYFYVIKKDDNASSILYKAQLKPIYTRVGTLHSLRTTNLKISDINHVHPGQKLYFSKNLVDQAQAKGTIQVLNSGEIVFSNLGINSSNIGNLDIEIQSSRKPTSDDQPTDSSSNPVTFLNPEQKSCEDKDSSVENQNQSEFMFAAGMGYLRIDSTQNSANAIFISKAIPSASIQWRQNWSQSWQTHASWQLNSVEFEEISRGTLEGGLKVSTSSFGFGVTHIFDSKLRLATELGVAGKIFSTSTTPGTARIQTKPISYLGMSLGKKVFEARRLSLAAELGGKFLMGSSGGDFETSSGSEFSAKLGVEHKLKRMTLFVSGQLSKTVQNTSKSDQTNTDLKSEFGVFIPIGGD